MPVEEIRGGTQIIHRPAPRLCIRVDTACDVVETVCRDDNSRAAAVTSCRGCFGVEAKSISHSCLRTDSPLGQVGNDGRVIQSGTTRREVIRQILRCRAGLHGRRSGWTLPSGLCAMRLDRRTKLFCQCPKRRVEVRAMFQLVDRKDVTQSPTPVTVPTLSAWIIVDRTGFVLPTPTTAFGAGVQRTSARLF